MHVLSGDDDLFVNQNGTASNTAVEIHPETFVYTEAKGSFGALYRQKKRHMGVGKLYKSSHRRLLSFDALSGFFLYILFIVSVAANIEPLLALGLFIFRWVLQIIIYRKGFAKLNATSQLWYLPLLDFVYYIYINVFGTIGTFVKTTQWK
ncbi:glycosyltransferase family 2 protein [Mucilaginibacter antarcticus]